MLEGIIEVRITVHFMSIASSFICPHAHDMLIMSSSLTSAYLSGAIEFPGPRAPLSFPGWALTFDGFIIALVV